MATYVQSGSGAQLDASAIKSGKFSPDTFFIESGTGARKTQADLLGAPAAAPIAPATAPIAAPAQAAATAPATAPPAPAVVDPKQLAASANQEALGLYEQTKDRDIDIRESQKVIRDLTAKITGDASTPPPRPPSLMEMFAQQRQQLGLEPLENQLAGIDSEIDRINTTAFTDADRAGEAPLGMRAIGNKQGAIGREAQRQVALLQVERSAVARQVANKTATLQMVMDFTQQDFANASQAYGQEFDRNVQALNILNDQQDREQTAQDRLAANATANLQTVWNSLQETGASFDSLSPDQRRSVNEMEMQAGLPVGFFESLPAIVPESKILSTTTRESGGMKYADVLAKNPATGALEVQSVPLGPSADGSGAGGLTTSQFFSFTNAIADDVRQDPDVKDFIQIRDGYDRVQTGAGLDNAQGDLALIFGYNKMLDPNSVVRETEFSNAEEAQGALQQVMNFPTKFVSGNRLTPAGRQHFVDAAKSLYDAKKGNYDNAVQYYGGRAQAFGIDPRMVLRDFGTQNKQEAPPPAPALDDEALRREYEQQTGGASESGSGGGFFSNALKSVFDIFN
jgi:hypothetical protein